MPLHIEQCATDALTGAGRREILVLCERAYGEDLGDYLDALSGTHLLIREEQQLLCHVLWVTRWLQIEGVPPTRTAYIELVATEPAAQNRGLASHAMREVLARVSAYDLAALAPSDTSLYARLGWRRWRGPLSTRRDGCVEPTPDEQVLIHPLPRTPRVPSSGSESCTAPRPERCCSLARSTSSSTRTSQPLPPQQQTRS